MAAMKTVWGIDLGQCALKALKLSSIDEEVQVEAFDIIEHPKILSQPDADRDQLVRNALEQFLARNDVTNSEVRISVPGQGSFTVFVKLPPVEPKKIPDIVRFEAEQQIPFPLEQVVWRWQTFEDPDSPDVELGLFAMKRADIDRTLRHFREVEMSVDGVQMAPLALYNFLRFDGQLAEDGATLLADVGAEQTDLVVADGSRIWTRSIQIGGNNFTEALVRNFKLSFNKAEKHKRVAASSKYARQIFQAMRPVFADLVQEIQRSIGYYSSTHRDTRFEKLLGLGNGFRLPGLQKYLEQNLNLPVVRVDSYNRLRPSPEVNAPVFTDNVLSFAVAYGLAIQGLGHGQIITNLLPQEIARQRVWKRKQWWFAGAAAALVVASAAPLVNAYSKSDELQPTPQLSEAQRIQRQINQLRGRWNDVISARGAGREEVTDDLKLYAQRNMWPRAQEAIFSAIESVTGQKVARLTSKKMDELRNDSPINERTLLFVEEFWAIYQPDLSQPTPDDRQLGFETATPGGSAEPVVVKPGDKRRGFRVYLRVRIPLEQGNAAQFVLNPFKQALVGAFQPVKDLEVPEFPESVMLPEVNVMEVPELPPDAEMGAKAPDPIVKLTYSRFTIAFDLALPADAEPEAPAGGGTTPAWTMD